MKGHKRRLRLLAGKVATKEILNAMMGTEKTHYNDLTAFASISSINQRLRELENLGLIKHHIAKEEKREEWYTITVAGKEFRKQLHAIDNLEERM